MLFPFTKIFWSIYLLENLFSFLELFDAIIAVSFYLFRISFLRIWWVVINFAFFRKINNRINDLNVAVLIVGVEELEVSSIIVLFYLYK